MNGQKTHSWVAATELGLNEQLARQATANQKLTIISRVTVDVIDVYCKDCRRTYTTGSARELCRMGPQHFGGPRNQPEQEWPPPHDPLDQVPGQLKLVNPD